jgi:hypothetical protein
MGQRHRQRRTEVLPAQPCPVVLALTEASRYDIYDGAVMIQKVWSGTLDLTILFIPTDFASDLTGPPLPDWKIEAAFPSRGTCPPEITVSGTLRALSANSPKESLGRAVLAAIAHLGMDAWQLPPAAFQVSRQSEGYVVSFLPPTAYVVGIGPVVTIGSHTCVLVSEDLKQYQILPSF